MMPAIVYRIVSLGSLLAQENKFTVIHAGQAVSLVMVDLNSNVFPNNSDACLYQCIIAVYANYF